jgi:hypothetical protein
MNGARRWPGGVGSGSLYVSTDCMDEDAIAKAVKAAAGLGPLRAAVITHIQTSSKIARHRGGINLADRTDSFGVSRPISMPFMI